jgi:hypothetical protein
MSPAIEIAADALTLRFIIFTSISRPTRKRNNTSPMVLVRPSIAIPSFGKMAAVKPGMWPMTDGPSRTPPMTSAITRGWWIRERPTERSCVIAMIITAQIPVNTTLRPGNIDTHQLG